MALCRVYGAVLVVARLDRLARNVAFVVRLMESGADFVAADFPEANRLTIHVIAAVAEYEATLISERTKAGLATAKARGVKRRAGAPMSRETIAAGAAAAARARRSDALARAYDLALSKRSSAPSSTTVTVSIPR